LAPGPFFRRGSPGPGITIFDSSHLAPPPRRRSAKDKVASMWFKNLKVFRLAPSWSISLDALESALEKHAYRPGNSLEMQNLGWVPPFENSGLAYALQGQIFLSLRAEKKLLPATVINQFARARAQEIEEQQGFKPGRKQMKEIKEQITDELLPKAFSVYRDTRVWIDTKNRWLIIDAAAAAKSDE